MDLVSPDMDRQAARYNMVSKVRDDSHAHARSATDLLQLVRQAGLADAELLGRREVGAR